VRRTSTQRISPFLFFAHTHTHSLKMNNNDDDKGPIFFVHADQLSSADVQTMQTCGLRTYYEKSVEFPGFEIRKKNPKVS
jgi:hypothetical protein